jgi:hypothetical protein
MRSSAQHILPILSVYSTGLCTRCDDRNSDNNDSYVAEHVYNLEPI